MSFEVRLAVDAMGGDFGLSVTVPAVYHALKTHPELKILLFGPAKELMLKTHCFPDDINRRLVICNAAESIAMSDTLADALSKPAASMRLAMEAVVAGRADALVTAGHTGALIALSDELVANCPRVTRPVFFRKVPTSTCDTFMLDIGAQLQASAKELVEYAFMGHYSARVLTGQRYPKIGLLNVGKEDSKGTATVKQAHAFLKKTSLNYRGFVEGHDVFADVVDVIVCDGFVGNIALKTAESASRAIVDKLKVSLTSSFVSKAINFSSKPIIRLLESAMDPSDYNGALLVGLTKNIVKSHGAANAKGFAYAISVGVRSIDYYLPDKITQGLQEKKLRLQLQQFNENDTLTQ